MRLADTIAAQGNWHPESARLAARIRRAQRFEVDADVVAAARQVSASKPSSVLSALPLCRFPYREVWIEGPSHDGAWNPATGLYERTGASGPLGMLFTAQHGATNAGRVEMAFMRDGVAGISYPLPAHRSTQQICRVSRPAVTRMKPFSATRDI